MDLEKNAISVILTWSIFGFIAPLFVTDLIITPRMTNWWFKNTFNDPLFLKGATIAPLFLTGRGPFKNNGAIQGCQKCELNPRIQNQPNVDFFYFFTNFGPKKSKKSAKIVFYTILLGMYLMYETVSGISSPPQRPVPPSFQFANRSPKLPVQLQC